METINNLLPCPFCNSEPQWTNEALADSHFYIKCPHCQIVMKEDRRDKVIGMWNTRVTHGKLMAENHNMKTLLKLAYEMVAPMVRGMPDNSMKPFWQRLVNEITKTLS